MDDQHHDEFLRACSEGNLELAKQHQEQVSLGTTEFLQDAFVGAISKKQVAMIDYLLGVCPDDFTSRIPDPVLLQAIDAGSQVYALFIRKDASAARRSFGHMGDALALAVMRNDEGLVRLLLDNGASPTESKLFFKPTSDVARGAQNIDKGITKMLNEHESNHREDRGWVAKLKAWMK
ncbi:hypothetical protein NUW58_g827 [Xylaria curta]|uniref:Uncharacterized protein n=2 Tax=Xylaria curta TaxID=42375 RepID=A0ACC1PIV0_9PEZI|nr:hypothetical protein NUW58_g2116 [Xylaria curta]KAJ2996904.1 hypothetical protein NUW58_g827 [Xylaria curta]